MKTPLYELHKSLGARFIDFAGWQMPLEYSSIKEESLAVRRDCGLFDISHMGKLLVEGREALEYLTSRKVEGLKKGRVQYNLLMNPAGGIKDDITIYRLSEDEFFLCVNAANKEKVIEWFKSHGLRVKDLSHELVQFALQGPGAVKVLSKHLPVEDIKYYHFKSKDHLIVSRTGYTGEDGFEVYMPFEAGMELFERLLKECSPCGLGARDLLRIEAGMPLYGHEISEEIDPFSANLDRYVSLEKDFIGKRALLERPVRRRLFGLELLQKGIPREGYRLFFRNTEIGTVSSGTYSYVLERGIAICFVEPPFRKEGLEVEVEVRGKRLKGRLVSYPFLKKV
jgi:aminomethyltransferase